MHKMVFETWVAWNVNDLISSSWESGRRSSQVFFRGLFEWRKVCPTNIHVVPRFNEHTEGFSKKEI